MSRDPTLVAARRMVTPDAVLEPGWLTIDNGTIADVGGEEPQFDPSRVRIEVDTVLPGFVDIHCHGGAGSSFTTGAIADAETAAAFHRAHGTTTMLASLVTAPLDEMTSAITTLTAGLAAGPAWLAAQIAGIHLEGPFLAEARCGAQNPAHMVDPSADRIALLLAAGAGADGRPNAVRMVTIAPERPGGLDAVGLLVAAGIVVAIGHTAATTTQAADAIGAGATVATHLGNAMAPIAQRDPGPAGVCLGAGAVTCELIVDGVHLDDHFVRMAARASGHDRTALVTDAISAAGTGDGHHRLGGLAVDVVDGVARLRGHGSLAGSTLTMDRAVRNAVDVGIPLVDVVRAASTTPARVLARDDIGAIAPRRRADLVLCDADLGVAGVVVGGLLVSGSVRGWTP